MSQRLIPQYKQLLLSFYTAMVKRGQDQLIMNINLLQKMQYLEQSTAGTSRSRIHKKQSQTTDCSLQNSSQTISREFENNQQQNQLQFTFNPYVRNYKETKKETMHFVYSNQSIYNVLLYSLLFNHLYLSERVQGISPKINEVFNLSKQNISCLVNIINLMVSKQSLYVDEREELKKLRDLLCGKTVDSQKTTKQELMNLINSLSHFVSEEIFARLACRFIQHCSVGCKSSIKYNREIKLLEQVSRQLGIRIKLKVGREQFKCGSSKSLVCYSIRKSLNTGKFSLKQISYYSKQRRQYTQRKRESNKQVSCTSNFLQI